MNNENPDENAGADPELIKTGVSSRRIADHLRSAILSGELAPGTRLRQEEIAEQHGSSRIPVREALRMVEADGLVTVKSYSGARVAKLDYEEFDTAYRIRERIDPLALAQSLHGITEDDIARLEELETEVEAATSPDRFVLLDREFHLATYAGCTDRQLLSTVTRFWNTTQHYRRAYAQLIDDHGRAIIKYEHRLLMDAIRRRDPVDAERFLSGHIRRTRITLAERRELFEKH
ncbi:GntR family transcriptional regulator [Micromonospora sp. NPDC092111]|uniref:GntR family transcriptional regulator n=1 Tax=Micromonospora sp. NPDC092111 TaxID=3364289 RepID=UPI003810B07C